MTFQHTALGLALAFICVATATTTSAQADTTAEQSCRLLDVLGGNSASDVAPAMADIAARWPEPNRTAAIAQLGEMLRQVTFAGGNVYEVGRLGEDLVDHLVVLRLAGGETAGMLLSYEWTPEGLALTTLDFKLNYTTELRVQIPTRAEPLACP